MTWIFWTALLLVVYTYLLYPLILGALTRGRKRYNRHPEPSQWPRVTMVLAAYNELDVIRQKLENTLSLDYEAGRLELIVVSDSSDDGTDTVVAEYADRGVRLHRLPERGGKTAAQNAGVRLASGTVLVFTDANSMYDRDALQQLVLPLADPKVGCVCGELRYTNPDERAAGKGEGFYWRYEQYLKRHESLLSSALGANGSIYALRRELFEELDPDVISDFIMPVRVWRKGFRVMYEPRAVAVESSAVSFREEARRRVRIISRSMYGLWQQRAVLNPLTHGWFAFQMLSHKVLRWLVPVFLIIVLAANAALAEQPLYRWLLGAQGVFYGLALCGNLLPQRLGGVAIFYVPAYFCATNAGALLGLWHFVTGRRFRVWQPVKRT